MIRAKTDSEIRQGVARELAWEPCVEGGSIEVRVRDGIVTLGGCVPSFAAKRTAEHVAQRVPGVRAVVAGIEVRRPGARYCTDADIACAVLERLGWHVFRPEEHVGVIVEEGWITLEGEMRSLERRIAAVEAVRQVPGVHGVHDLLTVCRPARTASGAPPTASAVPPG